MTWEPATAKDVETAAELGNGIHADYPEDYAVFLRRYELYPDGFLILRGSKGELGGYAVFHPWALGAPPHLNAYINALPKNADCLHLHDVAIDPAFRGQNHGAALMGLINRQAHETGMKTITLVAVGGTEGLWRKFGFRELDLPEAREACESYSETSTYMVRSLT